MIAPNDWRFCLSRHIVKPDSPEARLIAEILNTYFGDIDLLAFRKRYSSDARKKAELSLAASTGIPPTRLTTLKRNVYSKTTKNYCSMISLDHGYFIELITKYVKYRLGIDFDTV